MDGFRLITACGLALVLAVVMAAIDQVRERRLVSARTMPARPVTRPATPGQGRARIAPPEDRAA